MCAHYFPVFLVSWIQIQSVWIQHRNITIIFWSSLQYKATDFVVPGKGKLEIKFTPSEGGEPIQHIIHDFSDGGGVAMGMFNTDVSIRNFAHCCFEYALDRNYPLYLRYVFLKIYMQLGVNCCVGGGEGGVWVLLMKLLVTNIAKKKAF